MSIRALFWGVGTATSRERSGWSLLSRSILGDVRTGILGGTFDPIHLAHLHTAESALHQLQLDRVLIVPAGDPWQKSGRMISSSSHRLAMCRLSIEGVAGLGVDERETRRDGPTFTINTLETFPADEELVLILGADAASRIRTWHRWEDVLDRTTLAVAPRSGALWGDDIPATPIEMGLLEISGTDIRYRVRQRKPFRFLVTKAVHDYIADHHLYANGSGDDMVEAPMNMESSS